ncbi:MAG: Alpha/Beta hydrolase protein [Monoraphidium minutum]|nr:MAG: Alpha/Beta hydrolase protein [Monoraphidium minutum]
MDANAAAPVQVCSGPAGEAELSRHYDEVLAALPFAAEARIVETPAGAAHVLVAGPPGGRPVVLWHGKGFPGPHFLQLFAAMADAGYRLYAPDEPCDAGSRSAPIPVDPANHGWGRWAAGVLDALGLPAPGGPPPVHVGMSFGGAVTLDLAAVSPAAIAAAALVVPISLDPAYDTPKYGLWLVFRLVLPILLHNILPCDTTRRWALAPIMTDPSDVPRQVLLVWKHLRYNQAPPPTFAAAPLPGFAAPTLALLAADDVFGNSDVVGARLAEIAPGCDVRVLPMKHAPSRALMDGCVADIMEWLAAQGLGPQL